MKGWIISILEPFKGFSKYNNLYLGCKRDWIKTRGMTVSQDKTQRKAEGGGLPVLSSWCLRSTTADNAWCFQAGGGEKIGEIMRKKKCYQISYPDNHQHASSVTVANCIFLASRQRKLFSREIKGRNGLSVFVFMGNIFWKWEVTWGKVWKCFYQYVTGDVGYGDPVRGLSEAAANTSALNRECEVGW